MCTCEFLVFSINTLEIIFNSDYKVNGLLLQKLSCLNVKLFMALY